MSDELTPPQYIETPNKGISGLINRIKYKLSLQKEIKHYEPIIKALEADKFIVEQTIRSLNEYNLNKIAEIEDLTDINKSLKINLVSKEDKKNWLKRFFDRIFKYDGYVFYINKAEELKIFKVNNFKLIYDINKAESYALHKKIGTFCGKPFFMVKYPYAISLDVGKNTLAYDAPALYNYINKVTKTNLTNWGSNLGLADFIKKNFLIIVIAILLILLFTTPQGQEILSKIIPSTKPV